MNEATDPLTRIRAINETALFDRSLGIDVVGASDGHVEIAMPWRPDSGQ